MVCGVSRSMFRTTQSPRGPEGNYELCKLPKWPVLKEENFFPNQTVGMHRGRVGWAGRHFPCSDGETRDCLMVSRANIVSLLVSKKPRNVEKRTQMPTGDLFLSFLMLQNGPGGMNTYYLAPLKLFSAPLLSEYWLGNRTFQLGQCYLKNEVLVSVDGKYLSVTHFSPFKQLVFQRN